MCKEKNQVFVKFRKNSDYSNGNKNYLIHNLNPNDKIKQADLNDMDQKGTHTFSFKKKEQADKYAKTIMHNQNNIFDVMTSEPIES